MIVAVVLREQFLRIVAAGAVCVEGAVGVVGGGADGHLDWLLWEDDDDVWLCFYRQAQ